MPKISVVMPVYNAHRTLSYAINSILAQIYEDFELIVVNELESNDGSRNIVEGYAKRDNRVKLIQVDTHKGYAESLNIGIREASGEYVAIMDADDYAYPNRFGKQVAFLDCHLDYVMCGTHYRIVFDDGQTMQYRTRYDDDELKVYLLFTNPFCHPTIMFRRKVFMDNNWYYSSRYRGEDFELWTRIDGKMANLPEVLLDYHRHGAQATALYKDILIHDGCKIIKAELLRKLHIDNDRYEDPLYLLQAYEDNEPVAALTDQSGIMARAAGLLMEIEAANEIYNAYNAVILARVLCERWNLYVRKVFFECADKESGLPIISYLPGKRFSAILAVALETDKAGIEDEIVRRISEFEIMTMDRGRACVVFGTGKQAAQYFEEHFEHLSNVLCFSDNNSALWGKEFFGRKIISPEKLRDVNYDWLVVSPTLYFDEISEKLYNDIHVDKTILVDLGILKFCAKI